MKIFITGMPGVGKTTLLKEIALTFREKGVETSGFITEELRENQKRTGFKILDLKTGVEKIFASKTMMTPTSFGSYYLNLENFESIALSIFKDNALIIIDEIGKMEFYSKKFKELLFSNLRKDINLIATLHRDFVNDFLKFGVVYRLTEENRKEIKSLIIKHFSFINPAESF